MGSAERGTWTVRAVDGSDVRLRSGRVGLMSVEVTAPVTDGTLSVTADGVRLTLTLGLDKLRTNFVLQSAARSLVKRHDAHELEYDGSGPATPAPWSVTGTAVSGDVNVELALTITPCGAGDPMSEIDVRGSANVGTVHLPLPGLGTIDDFAFEVAARLALAVQTV